MKRADLIRTIEQGGCVLYAMEANTIGIGILPQVSRSQFPGIERSKSRLLAALSDFCWIARQNRPAGITDSPQNNAIHQTRHHDDLVAPSPLCVPVMASVGRSM